MGFKEDVKEDLDGVFFDEDFFAEWHKLDGEDILVVVDEDELEEINRKEAEKIYQGKVNKYSILFYVRESDIKRKLTVNSSLDYDGSMYFVNGLKKQGSLWRILLGRNQV